MGLGKTVQALAVAKCFEDEWPVLVISPSSLREQWADAIAQWLKVPEDHILVPYKQGDALRELNERCSVKFVVVSYDLVTRIHDALAAKSFGVIVLDEAHMIKSPKVRSCAVESFDHSNAKYVQDQPLSTE